KKVGPIRVTISKRGVSASIGSKWGRVGSYAGKGARSTHASGSSTPVHQPEQASTNRLGRTVAIAVVTLVWLILVGSVVISAALYDGDRPPRDRPEPEEKPEPPEPEPKPNPNVCADGRSKLSRTHPKVTPCNRTCSGGSSTAGIHDCMAECRCSAWAAIDEDERRNQEHRDAIERGERPAFIPAKREAKKATTSKKPSPKPDLNDPFKAQP